MSDEAILSLVRDRLGVKGTSPATFLARPKAAKPAPARKAPARKAPARKARKGRKRAVLGAAAREQLLSNVEKTITQSKGLSVSEVATRTKQPKSRVAAAIRELKAAGKIAQGGEKRFARYARDKKTALAASNAARGR